MKIVKRIDLKHSHLKIEMIIIWCDGGVNYLMMVVILPYMTVLNQYTVYLNLCSTVSQLYLNKAGEVGEENALFTWVDSLRAIQPWLPASFSRACLAFTMLGKWICVPCRLCQIVILLCCSIINAAQIFWVKTVKYPFLPSHYPFITRFKTCE